MAESARSDRFLRYSGLVDPQTLIDSSVLVLGVGAIGRQVALQLAAMGVGRITLQDMDVVEEVNMGAQGYRPDQLGQSKTHCTMRDVHRVNPRGSVVCHNERFEQTTPDMHAYDAVFCCVDCMDARKNLFAKDHPPRVGIDTRMSGYVAQLYCVTSQSRQEYVDQFLFSNEDAYREPCTARSTIFTASIIAGMAITMWAQQLRSEVHYPFMSMSLHPTDWVLEPIARRHSQQPDGPDPSAPAASEPPADTAPSERSTEAEAPAATR